MSDADSESSETLVWLDFSKDYGYINDDVYQSLLVKYEEVGRMLGGMADHPGRFTPKDDFPASATATYFEENE